jgi:hypothetical protein
MIPFKYGTIVSGKDFCGRGALLKQISTYIASAQNIVVLGERRVGKSSAVYEAVRRSKCGKLLYVDLLGIKSIDALCRRILRAIVLLEKKKSWIEKVVRSLAYLRPSISVDPITSMPTVSFDAAVELQANSISEVFDLIESIHQKSPLVVVFDEFQDVLNVEDANEALALIRGKVQFQGHVPYAFVGSIRHRMDHVFSDHNSPFFKSAVPITVDPLPYDEFSRFLKKKFATGNREVPEEILEKIFEISHDIPGDVQQLCEALWEVTSEKDAISADALKNALILIFAREQKSYENYVRLLTNLQFKCLVAIAMHGGKKVSSVAFLKAGGFNNPSSVKKAIARLTNINILFEKEGEFKFINPFFRAWLLGRG